jgi:hypothetical protein
MCWRCDNPDEPEETYLRLVRSIIDEYGWFVQAVGGDRLHPPFAYTVGLTDYGRPELLVNGLPRQRAGSLLNHVAHSILFHSGPLEAGQVLPKNYGPALEVVDLPEPTAHLFTAVNLYGPAIRAQQLVYADDRGHWPWDVGFRGRQRVFGPRAPEAA